MQKDQQSPCFKERAADSLIISGYPGDRPRIYSFLHTWDSFTCGGGCLSPFRWRWGEREINMSVQNPTQALCKSLPHFNFCEWHQISFNPPGLKPQEPDVLHLQSVAQSFLASLAAPAGARLLWPPAWAATGSVLQPSCWALTHHVLEAQCAFASAPLRWCACCPLMTNSRTMHSTDWQNLERASTCFSVSVP